MIKTCLVVYVFETLDISYIKNHRKNMSPLLLWNVIWCQLIHNVCPGLICLHQFMYDFHSHCPFCIFLLHIDKWVWIQYSSLCLWQLLLVFNLFSLITFSTNFSIWLKMAIIFSRTWSITTTYCLEGMKVTLWGNDVRSD